MLLSCLLVSVSALEKPTEEFYAGDFADVFSTGHEEYYVEQGRLLQESCSGAQIAVVSVPSLEGETIEQYANDLFNDWGIGDKEENNGLLILLAPNERQIKIEVGYGLEGALNDAKTGRLMDEYAVPSLREDDFDGGVYSLYRALLAEVYREYEVEPPPGAGLQDFAPPEPHYYGDEDFLLDQAQLLSEEVREHVLAYSGSLYDHTGIRIACVISDETGSKSAQECADALYEEQKISREAGGNGESMILFYSPAKNDCGMAMGEVIGYHMLSAGRADYIIEQRLEKAPEGQMPAETFLAVYDTALADLLAFWDYAPPDGVEVLPEAPKDWSLSNLPYMMIPFIFVLIFVLSPLIAVIKIIKAGGIRKCFKEGCKESSRSSRGGGSWGGSSGSSSSSRSSGGGGRSGGGGSSRNF